MMTDRPLIGPVGAPDWHVMSFNVRRPMPRNRPGSPDRWAVRRPLVRRLLAAERPTVLGVQEALGDQVEEVGAALGPSHRWIGTGRDPGGRGEATPVYYDAERLELTGWRQHALSATPEEHGSRSWGNLTRRTLVSAAFTDRETGARLHVLNTHLDHLSRRSRLQSALMIARLAHDLRVDEPDAAIVVTGDFNADQRSAVHRRLTAEDVLRDAWQAAPERLTPDWGTFSNYGPRRAGGRRIDLILVGGAAEVASAGINAVRFEGRAASDHEPVQAVLRHAGGRAGEARRGGG
ncbi:endonuclease/exonuclease/phosphatase family protein [Agromyces sp. SYSU T0242]|uniref:endonuclease/exonuclease/phosphatase family protein n=1 Tax=Agromyces litoreus TaxID=3158561 RepID=UPI0033987AC0